MTEPRSTGEEALAAAVDAVAAALSERTAAITASMRDVLSTRIPELQGDAAILDLLGSSIEGNLENILHALRHGIAVEYIEPPSAAFEYARRLAQRGVAVNALVRAYRLGQQHLLENAFVTCARLVPDAQVRAACYQRVVATTFDYIDWISQRIVTVYESERERWLADRDTTRFARVRDIIEGTTEDVDGAEAALGYRLRARHLGAILWVHETGVRQDQIARFSRVAAGLAEHLGTGRAPLVIPRDRASVWAWIPVPEGFALDLDGVRPLLVGSEGPPVPMVAFGRVHGGLAGFRQTHLEAARAQRVAMIRDEPAHPVIGFEEAGLNVAALLARDVEETRAWVHETLGGLALAGEQHERLRETLLLFFQHDGSYTGTAEAMVMHKNSVKYRVAGAEKLLGRSIGEDRQAIELALTACHWLGAAVLVQPPIG